MSDKNPKFELKKTGYMYDMVISSSAGVVYAYRQKGKWHVNDAENALETIYRHLATHQPITNN